MNDEMNTKIHLLIRSERALLRMEIRKRSRQVVFIAIALLSVLATLVMLNTSTYLFLIGHYTPLTAVMVLTVINFVFALLFFMISARQDTGPEAESMMEIRDFAWNQLSGDIDGIKQGISDVRSDVQRVSDSVNSVFHRDSFGIKSILPILQALLEVHSKRKK